MTVHPATTEISLGICLVCSESSLCTQWVAKDPSFLRAKSKDWSDWTDAQADLSLRWAHRSFCWFCHEAVHLFSKHIAENCPPNKLSGLTNETKDLGKTYHCKILYYQWNVKINRRFTITNLDMISEKHSRQHLCYMSTFKSSPQKPLLEASSRYSNKHEIADMHVHQSGDLPTTLLHIS